MSWMKKIEARTRIRTAIARRNAQTEATKFGHGSDWDHVGTEEIMAKIRDGAVQHAPATAGIASDYTCSHLLDNTVERYYK